MLKKNYNYNMFSIVCKGSNMYHLSVIESLFIKTNKPIYANKNSLITLICLKYYNSVTKIRFCCLITIFKESLNNFASYAVS